MASDTSVPVEVIELSGQLDRQTAEALHLELSHLATQYGIAVGKLHVDKFTNEPLA